MTAFLDYNLNNNVIYKQINTMRPVLTLQPYHNSSTDILKCFIQGVPITPEQTNFLDFHQKQLSSKTFDPVIRYYLAATKKHHHSRASFLLTHEILNLEAIEQLKKRLVLFLQQGKKQVVLKMTQAQFLQFKNLTMQELIFWHGNQTLTGAPFFPGGIPPVLYFQWGNIFGIVKYLILAEEKSMRANLLIYFEDKEERDLDEFVMEYEKKLSDELLQQNKLLENHDIDPSLMNKFLIKTPVLEFNSK